MLTISVCTVHPYIHGLDNIHCVRYLTAIDSLRSTSPAVQKYHHATSCSVKVHPATSARNSRSIGEEPVPYGILTIRRPATLMKVSYTEQGIITFTDILQSHKTVVLVCCTSEWEPDTTWMKSRMLHNCCCWWSLMCSTNNTPLCTLSVVHGKDLVTISVMSVLHNSIILTPVLGSYKPSWSQFLCMFSMWSNVVCTLTCTYT